MVLVSGGDIVSIPLDSWSLKVTVVTHAAVKLDYFLTVPRFLVLCVCTCYE